jgi:hypothetical protein
MTLVAHAEITAGGMAHAAAPRRRRRSAAAPTRQQPDLSGRLGPAFTPLVTLQACHMAEVTGTLRATDRERRITISFQNGEVVAADSRDASGLASIVSFGTWTGGEFAFVAGTPAVGTSVRGRFDWLMLEVCRQVDERARRPAHP